MAEHSKWHLLALLLPTILLSLWAGWIGWQQAHSPVYEIALRGYDPRDIVYGKFIQFRYDWDNPKSQKPDNLNPLPESGRFYVPEYAAVVLQDAMMTNNYHFKVKAIVSGSDLHIKTLTINGEDWKAWVEGFNQNSDNILK